MMEMNGLSSTALAAATSVPIVAAAANVAGLPKENGHSHLHHHQGVETDPLVLSMKLATDPTGAVHQVHLSQENGVGVTTADLVNNVVVGNVSTANAVLSVNSAAVAAQQQAQRIAVATTTTGTDSGGGQGGGGLLVVKEEPGININTAITTLNNVVTQASPATSIPVGGGGGILSVAPSASNPAPTANGAGYENKLFVGGLSWQTSSEKLREYFGKFGQVLEVQVVVDPMTQRSRGFGFITFADAETVRKIVSVPNHILDGKRIDPKHATPRNKQVPAVNSYKTKKIFLGGVSQDTTLDEIKAYFGQFGKVEDAVMLMDQQTMRHRGFGFVTFESDEVVEIICEIHYHTIKDKKVECKKAKPKEAQAVVAGVTGLHHAFGHDAAAAAAAAHHLSLATSAAANALGAQRTNPAAAYAAFYGGHLGIQNAAAAHQAHHQATTMSNHFSQAQLQGGLAGSLGIIPGAGGLTTTMVNASPGPTYSSIRSGLTRYTPYPVRNYVTSQTAGGQPPPPPPPSAAAAAAAAQMSAQPTLLSSLSANQQAATASQFAAYHHAAAAHHHASLTQNPSASATNQATALDFAGIQGIQAGMTNPQNAGSIHPGATFDWSGVYHV